MTLESQLPASAGPMRVLERGVYRGPHIDSLQPMVHFTLDLGGLATWRADQWPDFLARLGAQLPGLAAEVRRTGPEDAGDDASLASLIGRVATELQALAGEPVGPGLTRPLRGSPGVYRILVPFRDEEVGFLSAGLALRLIDHLLPPAVQGVQDLDVLLRGPGPSWPGGEPFDLSAALDALRTLIRRTAPAPVTQALLDAARAREIPGRVEGDDLLHLGYGRFSRKVRGGLTSATSFLAVQAANDRHRTRSLLEAAGVPTPEGRQVRNEQEALRAAAQLEWPVVTKPLDGNHGRGVSLGLTEDEQVRRGFEEARQHSRDVVVEQHFQGNDHRVLVIDGEVVAVAERVPAHVVGDGVRSIEALVEEVNLDPRRGEDPTSLIAPLVLDEAAVAHLARRGRTPASVPQAGERVTLQETARFATGATATDRTADLHPENASVARTAALALGLDVAGVDLVAPDLARSVRQTGGGVVGVRSAPDLRWHLQAGTEARDVAGAVLDSLYPPSVPSRVPIFALTGTNGKSTTARMVAHILTHGGHTVGLTNTSGVYVGAERILAADATGPRSAQMVLRHPLVTAAVLETARGGLLRDGLGFDEADVGAVLNVQADHLGLRGIDTLEDLAWVKSLLVRVVSPRGVSVLNADDPRTLDMRALAGGRVALFSLSGEAPSEALLAHIREGGMAAVREPGEQGDELVLYRQGQRQVVMLTSEIPATLDGLALFNVANALAACLMCVAQGTEPATVRAALSTFRATFEQNPGRLNVYDDLPFRVVLDYAHNPAGLAAQGELLQRLRPAGARLIGMVSVPGDRRDADIRDVGASAAQTFDELVFREGPDGRGRPRGEVMALLQQGALEAGFPPEHLHLVLEEWDAVEATLRLARPGDIVTLMPTAVEAVWQQIQAFQPTFGERAPER
ncbi:cyanophycin synthetase [Deinococcus hohokamensis]|uniref:Cyanophycin synthetase n=1 Tax=Deinococcus hohokamensis TaxID=309883 RepID=A0ABV9I9W5_9DEIO